MRVIIPLVYATNLGGDRLVAYTLDGEDGTLIEAGAVALPAGFGRGLPLALVTGANSGVGLEAARALLARGYAVIVAARSAARGGGAAAALAAGAPARGRVAFLPLDLANLTSVVAFALSLRRAAPPLTLRALVLNAGMNVRAGEAAAARVTGDGWEVAMQSNFLGHFLLAELLLPRLLRDAEAPRLPAAPARLVTLSSVAHRFVPDAGCCDWPAAFARVGGYTYDLSKLACTSLALRLARQMARLRSPAAAVAVNPGAVLSNIWSHWPDAARALAAPLMAALFLTPAQGAAPVVAAAADAGVASGSYLVPYAPLGAAEPLATLGELLGPFGGVHAVRPTLAAEDAAVADALVAASLQAVARALDVYTAAVAADGGAEPAESGGGGGWLVDVPFSAQVDARIAEAQRAQAPPPPAAAMAAAAAAAAGG